MHDPIPVSWVIPLPNSKRREPFAPYRLMVDIRDEGAGPYMSLRFENDEPGADEKPSEGYLNSMTDIDALAERLKFIWLASHYSQPNDV